MRPQGVEREPVSARGLVVTWVVLLVLAVVSWAISYVHLGPMNVPIALAIALLKAGLVAAIFMELAIEAFTVRITIAVAVAFVVLLAGLMIADVVTRGLPILLPPPSEALPAPH